MFLSSFLLFPGVMKGGVHYGIPIVGIIGLMLVGTSPNIEKQFELKVHAIGAVVGMICSILWVIFDGYLLILIAWVPLLVYYLIRRDTSSLVFWTEMTCYITLYLNILTL
jgi:hypothetical protein